ncbi:MAG: TetR/AcrR family transcriptional regulator [Ruminococcus sp.]|nr:TetR/AcrR family transcriptional regulator [Ruminococcus sp.]
MPPKPKFTREEVVDAALKIVAEKGMEALTSRELGAVLGSSARPIFTVFSSMEELCKEVRNAALRRFEEFTVVTDENMPPFKQFGMKMTKFATEQPRLFRLLHMCEMDETGSFEMIFRNLGDTADRCIKTLQKDYGFSIEDSKFIFKHTWIYTYGICVLIATKMCSFTEEQISEMITFEFQSIIARAKSGNSEVFKPYSPTVI